MEKTEKTHWLANPNKNYLGHWDLPDGKDIILTIKSAQWESVENPVTKTKSDKRVVRWVEPDIKPFICNQTNADAIVKSTGVKYMEDSAGKKIQLGVSTIKVKGEETDAIRVRIKPVTNVKPELLPTLTAWKNAVEYLKKGNKIEKITGKYSITPENLKKLLDESKVA